jgi:hypothetical protein
MKKALGITRSLLAQQPESRMVLLLGGASREIEGGERRSPQDPSGCLYRAIYSSLVQKPIWCQRGATNEWRTPVSTKHPSMAERERRIEGGGLLTVWVELIWIEYSYLLLLG